MSRRILTLFVFIFVTLSLSQQSWSATPTWEWSHVYADAPSSPYTTEQRVVSSVTTPDGKVAIAIEFFGELDLNGTTYVNAGSYDTVIALLDTDGSTIWATHINGLYDDLVKALACDENGNVYIAGESTYYHFPSDNYYRIAFLAKYDPSGTQTWLISTPFGESVPVQDMVLYDNEHIYLLGDTYDSSTVTLGSLFLASVDGQFIAKFDLDGNGLTIQDEFWGDRFDMDSNGNFYMGGDLQVSSPVTIQGSTFTGTGSFYDILFVKFDPTGILQNGIICGGGSWDGFKELVVNSADEIIATGHLVGSGTFGGLSATGGSAGDIYIFNFDTALNGNWITMATGNQTSSQSLDVDGADRIYATGHFFGDMTLGTTTVTASGGPSGGSAIWAATFESDGTPCWLSEAGGTFPSAGQTISAVDDGSAFYVGGSFAGDVTLWGTNAIGASTTTPDGFCARFVFEPDEPPCLAVKKSVSFVWDSDPSTTGLGEVAPGGFVEYRFRIKNCGTSTLEQVYAIDQLPDDVTYNGSSFPPLSIVGNTITWQVGPLAPGQIAEVFVWVFVNEDAPCGEELKNTVFASTDDIIDLTDPLAEATIDVVCECALPAPEKVKCERWYIGTTLTNIRLYWGNISGATGYHVSVNPQDSDCCPGVPDTFPVEFIVTDPWADLPLWVNSCTKITITPICPDGSLSSNSKVICMKKVTCSTVIVG